MILFCSATATAVISGILRLFSGLKNERGHGQAKVRVRYAHGMN
jgi:hypothetical protein